MGLCRTLALVLFSWVLVLSVFNLSYSQNSPQDYLDPHNLARAAVGVGPMTWDNTVAAFAENYANQRKSDCRLVHSGGPYGENIFWGSGHEFTAKDAIAAWVSEKQYYEYNTNSCQNGQQCGQYTQVIWHSSVKLGCSRVQCDSGAWFITCNYSPRGNIVGETPFSVLASTSTSTTLFLVCTRDVYTSQPIAT